MLSTGLRKWIARIVVDRTGIFTLLVLLATVLATGVSFYATAQGLHRYFAAWVAIGLALAVQLGLFGLAWLVGLQRTSGRLLTAALYLAVMSFSVTFSYVFFQSELSRQVKPAVQARELTDQLESGTRLEGQRVNASLTAASEAKVRIASWLQLEDKVGFSMQTCADEPIAYLNEVCDRLRKRISSWEQATGRPYRQGPGQNLIYGALQQELEVIADNVDDLGAYYAHLQSRPFAAQTRTDDRIAAYNRVLTVAPVVLLERYSALPVAGGPQLLARSYSDAANEQEAPFGALLALPGLAGPSNYDELDLVTAGSLLLALFVDLFVLAVAWGVGRFDLAEIASRLPVRRCLKPEWDDDLLHVVGGWIREATLKATHTASEQIDFVRNVLERIQSQGGEFVELAADEPAHRRFAEALVRSKVATLAASAEDNGRDTSTYRLKVWVPAALVRFMQLADQPQTQPGVA